jgi:periplasmic divalent cation tolerance protein
MSVDIPSGWDVDKGDVLGTGLVPAAVVSLTLPKRCMMGYQGTHYVGGRFMPPALAEGLGLTMPDYGHGVAQVVKLTSVPSPADGADRDGNGGNGGEGFGCAGTAAELEPLSVVYVTAPSMEVAKMLSRLLLVERVAACVNISPKVVSIYKWDGKVEEEDEVLVMIKTRTSLVGRLTSLVKGAHPYDVPEVIAMPLDMVHGNVDYLQWVTDSTSTAAPAAAAATATATATATVSGTMHKH